MTREEQPTAVRYGQFWASLGALQVETLRALYERDVGPDVIVGTSAGALNGAFIASRPQTVATADALAPPAAADRLSSTTTRISAVCADTKFNRCAELGGGGEGVPARAAA